MDKCRFYDICPAVQTFRSLSNIIKGDDQNEVNNKVLSRKQRCEDCKLYEKEEEIENG